MKMKMNPRSPNFNVVRRLPFWKAGVFSSVRCIRSVWCPTLNLGCGVHQTPRSTSSNGRFLFVSCRLCFSQTPGTSRHPPILEPMHKYLRSGAWAHATSSSGLSSFYSGVLRVYLVRKQFGSLCPNAGAYGDGC